MTFLVVEDSITIRHLLCYLLLSLGIKGLPVETGDQARRELAAHPEVNGAIVDVDNKGTGGMELIKALKSDPLTKELTIIAHTVQTQKETVAALAQAGVTACLLKPFHETETYQKLKNILAHAAGPEANQRRHLRVVPPVDEMLRVHFRVSGAPGLVSGKVKNLSMGGMGVELITPGAEELCQPEVFIERLQFTLLGSELAPSGVIVVAQGKIVGIRFTALGTKDTIVLARYVYEKLSS